jgi:hypothetical protein
LRKTFNGIAIAAKLMNEGEKPGQSGPFYLVNAMIFCLLKGVMLKSNFNRNSQSLL